MANHLQVEKHARKTKVYKVLTALIQEAETFQKEKLREPPAQKQQAPMQATSAVKYKAPELSAGVLKFPCTPFDFIDWKDNMLRWLKGAQAHLTFNDLISSMFNKLDKQWQTFINSKLKERDEDKTINIIFG